MAQPSRLGELGALTRALIEAVAREVDGRSDYTPERSLGAPDYLPAWFLRVGMERARAVARLEILASEQPYFGTAFLVAPGVLMTNHHVLPEPQLARGARALFDYEDDEQGRRLAPQLFELQPERLYFANPVLDFALVAVAGQPGERWGTIPLRHGLAGLEPGARVNLIQHPGGRHKQVVVHGNRITQLSKAAIHYLADTEGGSSGSPVFNSRWELIALHHLGGARDNVGVRMDAILKFLTVEAARRGAPPLLGELLEGVVDTGDFGLFATAGLAPPPEPLPVHAEGIELAGERTTLDWMGGVEFLDPGYWDLGALLDAAGDSAALLEALAAALDECGADFVVLEGIPAALRQPLAAALTARGQGSVALGERSLLVLDAAVHAAPDPFSDEAAELAASTCAGRPLLPPGTTRLRLEVRRSETQPPRALHLIHLELDPGRELPSRAHRNELARLLGELVLQAGRDAFVIGALAGAVERPGLTQLVAPPELTILAQPGSHPSPAGTIAWIGDGRGSELEQVHCWPELRSLHLDAEVARVDRTRRPELPDALLPAGRPLLARLRFALLDHEVSETVTTPPISRPTRELVVDAHVKSLILRD